MEGYYTITIVGKSHQKLENFWMKKKIRCTITCLAKTTSGVPISILHFFFLKLFIYLLFYFGSLLLSVGLLYLWPAGATPPCSPLASHCGGFPRCGAQALGTQVSVVAACRLSSCDTCSLAWVIFPDQGWNLCPQSWQANSYPLYYQGSPSLFILY